MGTITLVAITFNRIFRMGSSNYQNEKENILIELKYDSNLNALVE